MTARRFLAASVLSAACIAGAAVAQDIPAKLAPPAGSVKIGAYAGKGVQIYACVSSGSGNEWALKAPEAQLVDAKGVIFAKHYAGPTWEAPDGSKIVGKPVEKAAAPVADAIPWLLLSAEPSGPGVFAKTRFVQRVKTAGGVGPTGACPTQGVEQRIPYSAEYVFYR